MEVSIERTIFLDIETIPGPNPPEPVLPPVPTRDMVTVPVNWKDPEKIEAHIDKGFKKLQDEHEFNVQTAKDKSVEEWRKESLLSHRGRILVIAWAIGEGPVKVRMVGQEPCGSESELMELFWLDVADMVTKFPMMWAGFNIRSFDLLWLWHRAVRERLWKLARAIPTKRYDKNVVDLREVWDGVNYQPKGTLDEILRFLGGEGKNAGIDGSKVFDFWRAGKLMEIGSYCMKEVEDIRQTFMQIGPAILP